MAGTPAYENTFVDSFCFRFDHYLSHYFSLLSASLSPKAFRNNWCILKSMIAISTYFLLNSTGKRKLEIFVGAGIGQPDRYTGIPNGLNTSLKSSSCFSLLWSARCFLPLFFRKSILSLFPKGYFNTKHRSLLQCTSGCWSTVSVLVWSKIWRAWLPENACSKLIPTRCKF